MSHLPGLAEATDSVEFCRSLSLYGDPGGKTERLAKTRQVRDEIKAKIEEWLEEIS